jgi:nucleotide-binding universal stress UspA family protein
VRRFKSILFVADGGEGEKSVLARAVRLASANSAKLTLFAALDADSHQFNDQETRSAVEAFNKAHLEERREELESLRQEAISEHPQLSVDVAVETGRMATSVILAVVVNHHDLVMKAAEGDTGKWKRLFGTGDQKLMRRCPCPVWIVKPSSEPQIRRILAAVDLNPTEPDTESLAARIMELATSLATEEGSELHVVHVWRLAAETALRGRQIDTTDVDEIVRGIEAAHQSELDGLLKPYPYDKRTVHRGGPGGHRHGRARRSSRPSHRKHRRRDSECGRLLRLDPKAGRLRDADSSVAGPNSSGGDQAGDREPRRRLRLCMPIDSTPGDQRDGAASTDASDDRLGHRSGGDVHRHLH